MIVWASSLKSPPLISSLSWFCFSGESWQLNMVFFNHHNQFVRTVFYLSHKATEAQKALSILHSECGRHYYCSPISIFSQGDCWLWFDAGRDWGQEEKGMTEDEMAGWHHWLDGHESQWSPGVGDGRRPGVLRFMGSQRVGHDWATDLIWSWFLDERHLQSQEFPSHQVMWKNGISYPLARPCNSLWPMQWEQKWAVSHFWVEEFN